MTAAEEWRPVVGYEGVYEVSSWGRVKRIQSVRGGWTGIRKPQVLANGYSGLRLSKDDKAKTVSVHRIVAAAFFGTSHLHVNHEDGNKLNNHVGNLEYVTNDENAAHASRLGLTASGEAHYHAVLTEDAVREIRRIGRTVTQTVLAERYGVTPTAIRRVLSGENWKHVTDEILPLSETVRCPA